MLRRLPAFALILMAAACAPAPEIIVLAPTSTLQGAIVPTRIATSAPSATIQPSATETITATESPTPTLTETTSATPSATVTRTATASATVTPSATRTLTRTPSATATTVQATATRTPSSVPPSLTPTVTLTASETSIPEFSATAPAIQPAGLEYQLSTSLHPATIEGSIVLDEPVQGRIDSGTPYVLYAFNGVPGTVIDVLMQAGTEPANNLIARVSVINPKGVEIARSVDQESGTEAAIHGLEITAPGTYIIVANQYSASFGHRIGSFTLTVSGSDFPPNSQGVFSTPIAAGETITGRIDEQNQERTYTYDGRAGEVISIELTSPTETLDTFVRLEDTLSNTLFFNDDDLEADSLNSTIRSYMLTRTGTYTILVTALDYNGTPIGDFELRVIQEAAASPGQTLVYRAPLDTGYSSAVYSDGTLVSQAVVGDQVDEDKNEVGIDMLLTFALPAAEEGAQIASASLMLGPCIEQNQGFSALGALTVLDDPYGNLNITRNFAEPSSTASILGILLNCDEPLDVTEHVRTLYADEAGRAQFRLTFRDAITNGQPDYVVFTPALLLTFEE